MAVDFFTSQSRNEQTSRAQPQADPGGAARTLAASSTAAVFRGPGERIGPAAAELLRQLKQETQAAHLAIEQSVRFLDADAPLSSYRDYLGQLLGFYEPLEARLLRVFAAPPPANQIAARHLSFEERIKAPYLVRDLLALGLPAQQVARLRRCTDTDLPSLSDLQEALGCLYVLEGATLGGRVVYHRLVTRYPAALASASAFLRCYGDKTRARWLAFGQTLARHAEDPPRIVRAAQATFQAMHRWLLVRRGDEESAG